MVDGIPRSLIWQTRLIRASKPAAEAPHERNNRIGTRIEALPRMFSSREIQAWLKSRMGLQKFIFFPGTPLSAIASYWSRRMLQNQASPSD